MINQLIGNEQAQVRLSLNLRQMGEDINKLKQHTPQ